MKTKILLVDDDEFLLDMYSGKFRDAGFDVDIANSGDKAIEKTKKTPYDAILLDIIMPAVDGYDVLRHLQGNTLAAKTIVVVHSNLGQSADIARGKALGAHDYLVKARYTPREVVERVAFHISQQR